MKCCKGMMHLITPSSFVSFQAMTDGDTTCLRLMKLGSFYWATLLLKETIVTLSYISAQNIIATLQTIVIIYGCNALMKATSHMHLYITFSFFHIGIGTGLRNPRVSAAGWPGVGVRVGFIQPSPNPYLPQRVDGLPRKFKLRLKRDQRPVACSSTSVATHYRAPRSRNRENR